jgi:hypothetical protein
MGSFFLNLLGFPWSFESCSGPTICDLGSSNDSVCTGWNVGPFDCDSSPLDCDSGCTGYNSSWTGDFEDSGGEEC